LAGVFAAETAVVDSNSARAVINEDRDMGDSFEIACVPWCLFGLIARKHFDPRPGAAPGTRRARRDPRALAEREGGNRQGERGDMPRPVSGTGRCVLSSIGYRVPVRASLKCVLSIQRF